MSSIRLYQIGRVAANVDTTSADTTLTSDLPAQPSSEYYIDVVEVQDISQITGSSDLVYILVDSEIISGYSAQGVDGFSGNFLLIEERGALGTSIESHDSGSNVYAVTDPGNATDGVVYVKDEVEDFRVHEVGSVEEAVEHEKGQFRINNMSMTISGVQPSRLSAVGSIQKPWVVEIENDNGTVIFSGFVKETAKYNAGTEKINLKAVSWLEILSRSGDIPARAVYETEVFNVKRATEGEGDLAIDIIDDPRLTSGSTVVGDKNDTIAIESDVGELRRLILGSKTIDIENSDRSLRRMYVNISEAFSNPIIDTSDSRISDKKIEADGVDGAYNALGQQVENTTKIYYDIDANKVIDRMAEFSPWDKGDYRALLFDSNDRLVQSIVFDEQDEYSKGDFAGLNIKQEMRTANLNTNYVENHSYYIITRNKGNEDILEKVSSADRSDQALLFGQDAWGYPGETENGYMTRYDASRLIDNLMTVNDTSEAKPLTGVLSDIYGGTTFDIGGTKEDQWDEVDPRVRFPTDPMEALRMIQQTSGFLLVEDTSTQSNGSGDVIPEVSYRILPRGRMTGDSVDEVAADITSNVLSWKEDVSEKDINAVVITPNEQYRGGGDVEKALGWYYEGIEEDENTDKPDKTTRPQGDDVIEIETNTMPSHEGVVYSGGGEEIRNDRKLKAIARKYYTHFSNASRKVEIELGRDNPDVLGKVVTFDEGNIDHRALITSKNFQVEDGHRKTTLEGRIAGKGFELTTDPEAIINGSNIFHADSNDTITVRLSGINSYDEASGTLSYSWDISGVAGTISGPQLDYDLAGVTTRQTRDITLTVTNNSTSRSGSVTKEIVFEPYTGPINAPNNNNVSFDKTQVTVGSTKKGRLEIDPRNNTSIAQDSNGNYLVQYIAKIGGEVPNSYTESDWITIASSDTDEDITGKTGVESRIVTNTDAFPEHFEVDVPLDKKHVSNILVRIQWNDATGFANLIRSHAFDFDSVAEVDVSVYNDESGAVYADVVGDEDTDTFNVEYRKNSGAWQSVLTSQGNDIVGYEVVAGDNVSDGDSIKVRITPFNFDGAEGKQVVRATFYNRSTGGAHQLDALTINGAGTIDSIKTDEFRFLGTNDNDNATINVFETKLDQITFSGGSTIKTLQKSIRGTGTATDDALVTEQAVREELSSIDGAESLSDLSDVDSAKQSDGHVLASGGGAYREEDISSLTEGHVGLSDLSDVQNKNRDDGDVPTYDENNTVYEHLSPNALIREHSDTGIFNEVLIGGLASLRQDAEPTLAEWETELNDTFSATPPANVIWVDTDPASGPSDLYFYDPDASSGDIKAQYTSNGTGYWIEKTTGLIDAGLITEGVVEANTIIADGTITGNKIKSETTITIGTNTKLKLDGINDRIYSTDYAAGTDGFEIDLKNSESQLPSLDVVGTLDADTWDQSLSEHTDAGTVSTTDGEVLIGGGSNVRSEALSASTEDHVDWADLSNVATSGAENRQIARYDTQASEWTIDYIADLIRERASLSIGDVSISGTWRTIEQDSAPSTRDNGDPLQDGDVWIDTDASPVAEAYVWRNGQWNKQASAVAGNNIVTDSVDADRITADTITANEISADTITARVVDTQQLFADQGTITDFTASTAMIDEIKNNVFSGNDATISNTLQVGTGTPHILIDGPNARVESSNFASDVSGFRLSADGFVEAENAKVRGELRSTVVKKNEVSAVGGQQMVATATQLDPVLSVGDVSSDGNDLKIEWTEGTGEINTKRYIKSVTSTGNDIEINYGWRTYRIMLGDDVADVGEKIRLKDAGDDGAGREAITTVQSKKIRNGKVLVEVDPPIKGIWAGKTAVTRWEERIIHDADSEYSPFSSYVDDTGEEMMRLGNLKGRASLDGYGIVIGRSNQLKYSTASDELIVKGRGKFDSGEIAGYTITQAGLRSGRMLLSKQNSQIRYLDPDATDLSTQLTNTNFSSGLTGWTASGAVLSGNNGNGDYVYTKSGSVEQGGVDATGLEGESAKITSTIDAEWASTTGSFGKTYYHEPDINIELYDADTGDVVSSYDVETNRLGLTDVRFEVTIPNDSNVADNLGIRLVAQPPDNADGEIQKFYDVTFSAGEVRARYGENKIEYYDNSGNLKMRIDPGSPEIEFGSNGARIYENGGDLVAEDSSGNTYTLT